MVLDIGDHSLGEAVWPHFLKLTLPNARKAEGLPEEVSASLRISLMNLLRGPTVRICLRPCQNPAGSHC
jgi:hypothetical protein